MTVTHRDKQCYPVGIAFDETTTAWFDKIQTTLYNYAHEHVVCMPKFFNKKTGKQVTDISEYVKITRENSNDYYAKGIMRYYLPVELYDQHETFVKNNFRIGPCRPGENSELDAIFDRLKEPLMQIF